MTVRPLLVYRPLAGGLTQSGFSRTAPWNPPISVLRTVEDMRDNRRKQKASGRAVGLVPTMGALHEGHLALARMAAAELSSICVSIYVNPTQFGVGEDLSSYPRNFESDLDKLKALNQELAASGTFGRVTAVFAPTTETMYPTLPPTSEIDGKGAFVTISPLGNLLEGASRPVFFRGVGTVCIKLFNIVQPDKVFFGQKDIQQTMLIKQLVRNFHLPIDVSVMPTRREEDGLAMSSRNVYLGARRRRKATVLFKALKFAEQQYVQFHKRDRNDILGPARAYCKAKLEREQHLSPSQRALFEVDYISLADPESMEEVDRVDEKRGAVLSAAVKMLPVEDPSSGEDLGENDGCNRPVRLIDNIILSPSEDSQ